MTGVADSSRRDVDMNDVSTPTHDDSPHYPRRLDTGHHSNDNACKLDSYTDMSTVW